MAGRELPKVCLSARLYMGPLREGSQPMGLKVRQTKTAPKRKTALRGWRVVVEARRIELRSKPGP